MGACWRCGSPNWCLEATTGHVRCIGCGFVELPTLARLGNSTPSPRPDPKPTRHYFILIQTANGGMNGIPDAYSWERGNGKRWSTKVWAKAKARARVVEQGDFGFSQAHIVVEDAPDKEEG